MRSLKGQRVVVAGAGGMLGRDLAEELDRRGAMVTPFGRPFKDITRPEDCLLVVREARPSIVFNCAAFTDVNGAESRRADAFAINGDGAGNLARASAEMDARCILVSTDYVFDGAKPEPYNEGDRTNPLNAYGASKLEGERQTAEGCRNHAIVRTSWLYGLHGKHFVVAMLSAARAGKPLRVVNDQVGAPTYTRDLARLLADLGCSPARGIFHGTNGGSCTWFEFAGEIFRLAGVEPVSLEPVSAAEFPTPAVRPANSRLAAGRLSEAGVEPLPDWHDGLRRFLKELEAARG